MKNVEEYVVKTLHGEDVKGPMKWIIVILGPNHQAKKIKKLIDTNTHKNINIICILITNKINDVEECSHESSHHHHSIMSKLD